MEAETKPQIKTNPDLNSETKNNLSKSKSVIASSSSKLLEGVVMPANSAISSNPPVKTTDFQGQYGMSHQEALANFTAKAAQAHHEMQLQTADTNPLIKPFPKDKVEEPEIKIMNSSCNADNSPDDTPIILISDGYNWRKYGQKQMKRSSEISRSYYRCTDLSCCAKKKVQRLGVSGKIIDVVYKGEHNHKPPQILRSSISRKKDYAPVYRTFKDPIIVTHEAEGGEMLDDGYRWRKYGQKMVKGNLRSYYRCSSAGCPVRKHAERATDNSTAIILTYEGKHDHDVPIPKRQYYFASPNATASGQSGANMLLDKTEIEPQSRGSSEERLHKTEIKSQSQGSSEEQLVKTDIKSEPHGAVQERPKDLDSDLGEEKGSEAGADKLLEYARTLMSIGIELKLC